MTQEAMPASAPSVAYENLFLDIDKAKQFVVAATREVADAKARTGENWESHLNITAKFLAVQFSSNGEHILRDLETSLESYEIVEIVQETLGLVHEACSEEVKEEFPLSSFLSESTGQNCEVESCKPVKKKRVRVRQPKLDKAEIYRGEIENANTPEKVLVAQAKITWNIFRKREDNRLVSSISDIAKDEGFKFGPRSVKYFLQVLDDLGIHFGTLIKTIDDGPIAGTIQRVHFILTKQQEQLVKLAFASAPELVKYR